MKGLRILILFIIVLSGCSKKYLSYMEEELVEQEVIDSWKELDCKVIAQNGEAFSLNLRVKNFVNVKDSLGIKEIYRRDKEKSLIGGSEIVFGSLLLIHSIYFGKVLQYLSGDEHGDNAWQYTAGCTLGGLILMSAVSSQSRKSDKTRLSYAPMKEICADSVSLAWEKVKIVVGNVGFEKIYYTDENGNMELSFEEIIPEPTEADSVLSVIVQYEEMVDTVDVKIR